jgi:hypothetical protein
MQVDFEVYFLIQCIIHLFEVDVLTIFFNFLIEYTMIYIS